MKQIKHINHIMIYSNIALIQFIITYNELPPFTELGRQKSIEGYNTFDLMIDETLTDIYRQSKYYEFNCCKYHITILIYDLQMNIIHKIRYESYNQYKNRIKNDINKY